MKEGHMRKSKSLFLLLMFCLFSETAQAKISIVSNMCQEYEARQGEEYEGKIVIKNMGEKLQSIKIYQTDYEFYSNGQNIYGPPGTMDKGTRAALFFIRNVLEIKEVDIAEGSGISRKNRISAAAFDRVLAEFQPYRYLLKRNHHEFYKTGTLAGINTRAGYLTKQNGNLFRYTVLVNTPGRSIDKIMAAVRRYLMK